MTTKLGLVSLLLSGLLIEFTAQAADHSAVLPFVTDDVVAIGYVDLTTIDMVAGLKQLSELGVVPPEPSDDAGSGLANTQQWLHDLIVSGAARVYVLLRTSDLQHMGSTWVLPLTEKAEPAVLIRLLTNPLQGANHPAFFPKEFQQVDGMLLAAMNKTQLDGLATRRIAEPRAEAMAALGELGDGNAGLIVIGDTDSRRVLREMFPRLPAPFESIDGRLLADDLLWGGVVIDLPPTPKVSLHIETSGPRVAATLQQSAVKGWELAVQMLVARSVDPQVQVPVNVIQPLFTLLKPRINGAAVNLTWEADAEELASLRDLLAPSITAAREQAQRNQRINQFRELALAAANYESTNRIMVGQANYDPSGKPLLSWRVHLLPFLGQQTVYAEFHLDEPWDSPHNRQLIQRMPDVYSDPNADVRRAVGAGRTTFVAPVAAETLFPPRTALPDGEPLKIRDVRDGVSKTILFVEVVPERAVVWTKPEDWNVNLDAPLQGLKRTDRAGFVAAFCDAHVRFIANDVDAQRLRAMLTRDGEETVD